MNQLFKNTIPLFLAAVLLFTQSGTVLAAESEAGITKVGGFVVKDITEEEVPEGIQVKEYNSLEEAYAYLEKIDYGLNLSESVAKTNNIIIPFSTVGKQKVDSHSVAGVGSIDLYVSYKTSGDSNTGKITYVKPYTQYTGFTLGFEWDEDDIGYEITSSKKDVYAYAEGTLNFYLLVNGVIKLGSRSVSLGGYAYCVR